MTNILPTARGWALLQQAEVALTKNDSVKARALAEMARAYLSFPSGTDDDSYVVWFTWAIAAGQTPQTIDFSLSTVTTSTVVDGDIAWNFGDGAGGAPIVSPGSVKVATYSNALTNKALTTNVATLTTNGPHGLIVGNLVKVAFTTPDAVFDGVQTVTAVPTSTTFTFAKTATNVTSVAAPGVVNPCGGASAAVRHVFPANGTYHVVAVVDSSANPAVLYDALVAVPYSV